MARPADPEAVLSCLPRADGSATYSYGGFTIVASANGPMEAQRRDEDPYEAVVEVVVRPEAGVGGTRERHLETVLLASLQQLIFVRDFPRCLFQVVLQVKTAPQNDYVNTKLVRGGMNLPILPALLQTAVLALISASIPLGATATSTTVAILRAGGGGAKRLVADPAPADIDRAESLHVLGFTSRDELLLAQSEGSFSLDDWERVYAMALDICCRPDGQPMALDDETRDGPGMRQFVRSTVEAQVAADSSWREGQSQ